MLCYYDVPFLAMKNPNRGLPCHLNGHVTSLWLWMMDPVPSGRTFLRHGSVSSAHSAVILVYELKFLEFQEIRQSLSLWTHCQTPSHLIVGAANLSSEGGQPALPHRGLDAILVKQMEMDHAALTLLYITVKPCSWLPEIGQQRQSTFSGSKCYLGLFVRHLSDEEVQRTCYMKNHNTQLSFFIWDKPPNTLNSVWLFGKCGTYPSSK